MFRWQVVCGILLGFAIALAVSALVRSGGEEVPVAGPVLPENEGHFRELVIHYEPSAKEAVLPVYTAFLKWLEKDVTVHVVTPSAEAFRELAAAAGPVDCDLRAVVVNHPMTAWSRDRWLALSPAKGNPATTLWTPREEAAAAIWPERAGDQRIAFDLAQALQPAVRARRSTLYFDGGDVLADGGAVFVMPRVLGRNIQRTVSTRTELAGVFERELKRRVILLDKAPDHHAGMFMASAGGKTMLVGDPALGRRYFPFSTERALLPGGADFSEGTQRLFDDVAAQVERAGYHVVRIPTAVDADGRTFLTYVNALIDTQGERRIVYAPFYDGAEDLNAAAFAVWQGLGYEVRPINSTSAYRHFGALHCLVNVLTRTPVGARRLG